MPHENGLNFCEICCWSAEIGVHSCTGGGTCSTGVVLVGAHIICRWQKPNTGVARNLSYPDSWKKFIKIAENNFEHIKKICALLPLISILKDKNSFSQFIKLVIDWWRYVQSFSVENILIET